MGTATINQDCWVSVTVTLCSLMDTHGQAGTAFGTNMNGPGLYLAHRLLHGLGDRHCAAGTVSTYRKYHQCHLAAGSCVGTRLQVKGSKLAVHMCYVPGAAEHKLIKFQAAVVHYATRVAPGTAEHKLIKFQAAVVHYATRVAPGTAEHQFISTTYAYVLHDTYLLKAITTL